MPIVNGKYKNPGWANDNTPPVSAENLNDISDTLEKLDGGAETTGVSSFNGRTGAVTPQSGDYTAAQVGARPSTWTPTAAQVGAVPTTRTVNGKALSSNISLTASDVSALPATGGTLTGDLRIKGPNNYGTKINLGDGDFVHLSEPTDDNLEIKAKTITLVTTKNSSGIDIDDLKTSVSEGKAEIAGAITDKGVSTSATASFSTMADNIRKITTSVPDHKVIWAQTGNFKPTATKLTVDFDSSQKKVFAIHFKSNVSNSPGSTEYYLEEGFVFFNTPFGDSATTFGYGLLSMRTSDTTWKNYTSFVESDNYFGGVGIEISNSTITIQLIETYYDELLHFDTRGYCYLDVFSVQKSTPNYVTLT